MIVKLTPNITNIVNPAAGGGGGEADALSLINTINSIVGVDLDTLSRSRRTLAAKAAMGAIAGPAVKPVALNMLSALGTDARFVPLKTADLRYGRHLELERRRRVSAVGSDSLQVCTAVMHYGFRIIEDLCDGLSNWMDAKGFRNYRRGAGQSLPRISDFKNFDLAFRAVARINL